MRIREVIDDHSLKQRLHIRQSHGDSYAGICPWCKHAGALEFNPHNDTFRCHSCRVAGTGTNLDKYIRRYGVAKV